MFLKCIFILLFGAWWTTLPAQSGCTDPQAENFDSGALTNDGSCAYATTMYQPTFLAELPATLNECSGLLFFDDQLWAHNDGGNEAALYQLDTLSGEVLRQVNINGATNVDWEDMAQDETHLYIGDIGNNSGNRTDLRIYKLAKADLQNDVASAEIISYAYADQSDFGAAPQAHNYDAEALALVGDSLHLFTKNWLDKRTRRYVLPTTPGDYTVPVRDEWNVNGLITAADFSDGTGMLLGYDLDNGAVFGWLLFDFLNDEVFSGHKRRIELGLVLTLSQAEALALRDAYTGYVGSERASVLAARLATFDLQAFLDDPVATTRPAAEPPIVYPNPAEDVVTVRCPGQRSRATLRVFRAGGSLQHQQVLNGSSTSLRTASWPPGLYYFLLNEQYGTWVQVR